MCQAGLSFAPHFMDIHWMNKKNTPTLFMGNLFKNEYSLLVYCVYGTQMNTIIYFIDSSRSKNRVFEKKLRNLLYKYLFVKTRMSTQISFLNHPLLPLNIVKADGHEKQLLHASKLAQILSNFRPNLPFSVSCGPSLLKIFCLSNFHWRIRTHTWRNLGWICVDQQAVDSFGKILMQTSNLFDWYWQLVKDWHFMWWDCNFWFFAKLNWRV